MPWPRGSLPLPQLHMLLLLLLLPTTIASPCGELLLTSTITGPHSFAPNTHTHTLCFHPVDPSTSYQVRLSSSASYPIDLSASTSLIPIPLPTLSAAAPSRSLLNTHLFSTTPSTSHPHPPPPPPPHTLTPTYAMAVIVSYTSYGVALPSSHPHDSDPEFFAVIEPFIGFPPLTPTVLSLLLRLLAPALLLLFFIRPWNHLLSHISHLLTSSPRASPTPGPTPTPTPKHPSQ